jgi:hypothetical protein
MNNRGLYFGKYLPPWGAGDIIISLCHLGENYEKRKRKRGNMQKEKEERGMKKRNKK